MLGAAHTPLNSGVRPLSFCVASARSRAVVVSGLRTVRRMVLAARAASIRRRVGCGGRIVCAPAPALRAAATAFFMHRAARACSPGSGPARVVHGGAGGALWPGRASVSRGGLSACVAAGLAVTSGPNSSFKPTAVQLRGENHASAAAAA